MSNTQPTLDASNKVEGTECYRINELGCAIVLKQQGVDEFAVVYGLQIDKGLNYADAAAKLGQAIMHALACESKLNNTDPEEEEVTAEEMLGEVTIPAVWDEIICLGFENDPAHGMILDRLGDDSAEIVKAEKGPAPSREDGRAYYDDNRELSTFMGGQFVVWIGLSSGQSNYWFDVKVMDRFNKTVLFQSEPMDEIPATFTFEVESRRYAFGLKRV